MKQPVGDPLHILTLLYSNTGCHVNEIVRKTGSKDKPRVLDSIKHLEKSNLVETKKLSHKTQKKIKILTPLGYEFAHLIDSIHRYENSYNKFKEAIKTNYQLPLQSDKNVLKNKLLSKGWDRQEVNSYYAWYSNIRIFHTRSAVEFIHTLVAKYASILIKFELNEFAKSILIEIIIETLNKHLSSKEPDDFFSGLLNDLSNTVELFPDVYSLTFGECDEISFGKAIKPIKYGRQEAYELMESIVLFLKSPAEFESLTRQRSGKISSMPDDFYNRLFDHWEESHKKEGA
jgi:DNA-binding HxlR family transcriptional regulator